MINKLIQEFLNEAIHVKQGSCSNPRPAYSTGYHKYDGKLWFVNRICIIAADPKNETKIKKYFEPAKQSFPIDKFLKGNYEIAETLLPVIDLEPNFFYFEGIKLSTCCMKYFYNLNPKRTYEVKINKAYGKTSPLQIIDINDKVIAMILPHR
jgi:hypothetical protein